MLKQHLQAKLNLAWRVGLRSNRAKSTRRHAGIWVSEARRVEEVESLGAELHTDALHGLEILEHRHIPVVHAVVANIRKARSHVAKGEVHGLAVDRLVEVGQQAILD